MGIQVCDVESKISTHNAVSVHIIVGAVASIRDSLQENEAIF